jgi:sigma-B regulation protein RsbU (phosphoserine phosphatase)
MQTVSASGSVTLPSAGVIPAHSSTDVAAYSKPARMFTGDFYLTHRANDRLWFILGDVAGKGAQAAVVMAMIQEELEHRIASCAARQCDPATTMRRLHEFLLSVLPSNRFATVAIGHLHDDGLLTIANGGHCPPLIARGGRVEAIASTGPVAGQLAESRWTSVTRQLAPGDAVLLFSDGLLEARSACDEEFGSDRIRDAFAAAAGTEARTILARVLASAREHAASFDDDLTVLAIRYR